MIKFALNLVCFFFLVNQIQAQLIYERIYPDEFPSIEFPIELSDGSTFSMASIDNICVRAGIRHIDSLGNEIMTNPFSAEAFSFGYHWIGHDSVLIWYENGAWDVGPDSFRISLWTPNGITKLHTTSARYDIPPYRQYGAYLYSPEQVLFRKTDTLYLKNLMTAIVEDSIVVNGISSIVEFEKSIIVFRKSKVPIIINKNLKQIYTWHIMEDFPFDTANIVSFDSFIVYTDGSSPSSIHMMNIYDETILQVDLASYLSSIEDVQSNKGFLFVKGNSLNGPKVLQIDRNFQVLKVNSLGIPQLEEIQSYHYYPDRVYAWGTHGQGAYKANYRMCYTYSQPEPIQYIDLKLDSIWIDDINIVPPNNPIYANLMISCKISNLSTDTIHFVSLHYDQPDPISSCFTGTNVIHWSDLSILPGGAEIIQFQTYSVSLVYGDKLYRHYVLEHGNYHFDSDTTNNTFNLWYAITSIDQLKGEMIYAYPNPFTDILGTSFSSDGVELLLYDQTGKMVSKGYDQLSDLRWLGRGVYYLQMLNGSSTSIQKVVKVE